MKLFHLFCGGGWIILFLVQTKIQTTFYLSSKSCRKMSYKQLGIVLLEGKSAQFSFMKIEKPINSLWCFLDYLQGRGLSSVLPFQLTQSRLCLNMRIIVVLYKDYLIFELYLPKKKKLMFLFDDNKQLLYSEYHKLKFYLSIIIYPSDQPSIPMKKS